MHASCISEVNQHGKLCKREQSFCSSKESHLLVVLLIQNRPKTSPEALRELVRDIFVRLRCKQLAIDESDVERTVSFMTFLRSLQHLIYQQLQVNLCALLSGFCYIEADDYASKFSTKSSLWQFNRTNDHFVG